MMRDYYKANEGFDNIQELAEQEDGDYNTSKTSDIDEYEYEQSMGLIDKTKTSSGGMTQLPTEYTEFNGKSIISTVHGGSQFNAEAVKKNRRSRADRARNPGSKSNTGTTSSGGVTSTNNTQLLPPNMFDYTNNQFGSFYGNHPTANQD